MTLFVITFETNDNTNDIRCYNDPFLDNEDNEQHDDTLHNDQDYADCSQDVWNQDDEQDTLCLHHPTV